MLRLEFLSRRLQLRRFDILPFFAMVALATASVVSWAAEQPKPKPDQDKNAIRQSLNVPSTAPLTTSDPVITDGDNAQVDPKHAQKMAKGLELFRKHIRSILVKRCLVCHGGEDIQGELDLSTRKNLLKGGSEGPAIKLGSAKQSRLYHLITHREQPHMPYEEKKLSTKEIELIAAWIDVGAPYDAALVKTTAVAKPWMERVIPDGDRR